MKIQVFFGAVLLAAVPFFAGCLGEPESQPADDDPAANAEAISTSPSSPAPSTSPTSPPDSTELQKINCYKIWRYCSGSCPNDPDPKLCQSKCNDDLHFCDVVRPILEGD